MRKGKLPVSKKKAVNAFHGQFGRLIATNLDNAFNELLNGHLYRPLNWNLGGGWVVKWGIFVQHSGKIQHQHKQRAWGSLLGGKVGG